MLYFDLRPSPKMLFQCDTPEGSDTFQAPMELTPTSGEQERHNVTVITVGSKYEVNIRSPAPSHTQNLQIK